LYGTVGGFIGVMILLVGYWSDVEIADTDESFDVRATPTMPSLATDDDLPD